MNLFIPRPQDKIFKAAQLRNSNISAIFFLTLRIRHNFSRKLLTVSQNHFYLSQQKVNSLILCSISREISLPVFLPSNKNSYSFIQYSTILYYRTIHRTNARTNVHQIYQKESKYLLYLQSKLCTYNKAKITLNRT